MLDFYKTQGGRRFCDKTMPDIAENLRKLNEQLLLLVPALTQSDNNTVVEMLVSKGVKSIYQIPHCSECGSIIPCECVI